MPVLKAFFMYIQWLTPLQDMWEEKSELWLQGGKITWIFRTDLETLDLFHMAYHSLSFNPEHVKDQFFLWRLEDLGLTAFCFKNSLRYKQMVLLPKHMHCNKPGRGGWNTLPPTGYLAINSSYVSNFLKNFLNMRKSHLHRVKDKATAVTLPCITMCVSYFLTKPLITQIIATNYIWRSN